MVLDEGDIITYISKICSLCKKRETCPKDKFSKYSIYEKTSMRCPEYEYDRPDENILENPEISKN